MKPETKAKKIARDLGLENWIACEGTSPDFSDLGVYEIGRDEAGLYYRQKYPEFGKFIRTSGIIAHGGPLGEEFVKEVAAAEK